MSRKLPFEVHPAADLFPYIEGDDFKALVEDIRQHGVNEPIIFLDGKLLDGRNRSLACVELGIDPLDHACEMDPETCDPVAYVMSANLHRRHLTQSQRAMVAAGIATLKDGQRKGRSNDLPEVSQADAATLLSVSVPSVKRAKLVLDSGEQDLITAVRTGDMPVSKAAEIVKERKPPISLSRGDNEWYTPEDYISAGRAVLGTIDLDPASSHEANAVVKASRFFTADDDGLAHGWAGKVWLNPPYSQPLCGQFIEKLIDDYLSGDVSESLLLVNSCTETVWFQMATRAAKAVCFPDKRLRFWKPDGSKSNPLQGHAVFYFGDDAGRFAEVFGKLGCVLCRIDGAQ